MVFPSKTPPFGRLAAMIGRESILPVHVLRVANSSFYGMRGAIASAGAQFE